MTKCKNCGAETAPFSGWKWDGKTPNRPVPDWWHEHRLDMIGGEMVHTYYAGPDERREHVTDPGRLIELAGIMRVSDDELEAALHPLRFGEARRPLQFPFPSFRSRRPPYPGNGGNGNGNAESGRSDLRERRRRGCSHAACRRYAPVSRRASHARHAARCGPIRSVRWWATWHSTQRVTRLSSSCPPPLSTGTR